MQKSLEVIEKSVPLQPDSKKHGLRGVLKKTETRKKVEKFRRKIWRLKNNAYLCSPVRKTGSRKRNKTSSLKRLLTVQEASTEKTNKFIEKR